MKRALALATLLFTLAPAQGTEYRIDTYRSQAQFGVRLLWLTRVQGHFTHIEGEVSTDPAQQVLQVDARIDVNSVQMESARFRRWVLAPEFFDAGQHPFIYFHSAPVSRQVLEHGGVLEGMLSLRGVGRPVHFEVLPSRCPQQQLASCDIAVRGNLRRSNYGMDGRRPALSDRVQFDLRISLR